MSTTITKDASGRPLASFTAKDVRDPWLVELALAFNDYRWNDGMYIYVDEAVPESQRGDVAIQFLHENLDGTEEDGENLSHVWVYNIRQDDEEDIDDLSDFVEAPYS